MRLRVESQWIVVARPLYHLQCPIAYLSRLQMIQSMDHSKVNLRGPYEEFIDRSHPWHVPIGMLAHSYRGSRGGHRV